MENLFAEELEALRARSLDRHLREVGGAQGSEVEIDGRRFINFSSNDYLGLANDPRLREAATAAINEFGVGAGASRLISGTQSPHLALERAVAKWKGTEAALCFSSGYAAALGTIPALVTKDDVVLLDKLCHASLIDAAKLSSAILRVFPHNHLGKLESHLEWAQREHPGKRVLIITESVFSMDGDRAQLRDLVELKKRFGALLMLDEAHAIGVIGLNGRGLAAAEDVSEEVGSDGNFKQGAWCEWRIHLRLPHIHRLADQSRALLHLFHRSTSGCGSGGAGGRRFPLVTRRRGAQAFALGKNQIDAGSSSAFRIRKGTWRGKQRDFPVDSGRRESGTSSCRRVANRRISRSSNPLSHCRQRHRAITHNRDCRTRRGSCSLAL